MGDGSMRIRNFRGSSLIRATGESLRIGSSGCPPDAAGSLSQDDCEILREKEKVVPVPSLLATSMPLS